MLLLSQLYSIFKLTKPREFAGTAKKWQLKLLNFQISGEVHN
jgi:hypothetical protein